MSTDRQTRRRPDQQWRRTGASAGYTLPPHDSLRLLLTSAYALARTRSTMDTPLGRMSAHASATMREQCRVTTSALSLVSPFPFFLYLSLLAQIGVANHRKRRRLGANLFREGTTIPDQHVGLISDSRHSSRFPRKCESVRRHRPRRCPSFCQSYKRIIETLQTLLYL